MLAEVPKVIVPILGVVIAAIIILAVPGFRKTIFKSAQSGNNAGREAGLKMREKLKGKTKQ